MLEDLQAHPEVLAEAIQTILRREGVDVPYEKLKELTRGRQVTLDDFARFIDSLSVDEKVKKNSNLFAPKITSASPRRIAKWRE